MKSGFHLSLIFKDKNFLEKYYQVPQLAEGKEGDGEIHFKVPPAYVWKKVLAITKVLTVVRCSAA